MEYQERLIRKIDEQLDIYKSGLEFTFSLIRTVKKGEKFNLIDYQALISSYNCVVRLGTLIQIYSDQFVEPKFEAVQKRIDSMARKLEEVVILLLNKRQ